MTAPDDLSAAVAGVGPHARRRTVSHLLAWVTAAAVAVCIAVAFPALLGDVVGIAVIAVMALVPWLLAVHDRRTDLPAADTWRTSPRFLTRPPSARRLPLRR